MLPSIMPPALLAIVALFVTSIHAQSAPTPTVPVGPITTLGCYNDVGTLQNKGSNTFQTSGSCQAICANAGKPVMATTQGSFCYCGDGLPPEQYEVANSSCSTPCNGYGQDMCGGLGFWTVYLTGLTGQLVSTQLPSSTASPTQSDGASSGSSQPPVVTKPGQTVVVTASSSPSSSSGGGSKVGIAVGVVVGIVALAGISGGAILYFKQKRRREIEEEHRRNAAATSYRPEPKNDSRLDANIVNARRTSIGSIADEGDYSRRILQVCWPPMRRWSHELTGRRCETQTSTAIRTCLKCPISKMYSIPVSVFERGSGGSIKDKTIPMIPLGAFEQRGEKTSEWNTTSQGTIVQSMGKRQEDAIVKSLMLVSGRCLPLTS